MVSGAISACRLFEGLSGDELDYAMDFFGARQRSFAKGEFINRISCVQEQFGLVLSGTVQVYMDDIDGHHMIMATVQPGGTFGESLCFLEREAPVYICAVTDVKVLMMDTKRLHNASSQIDIMLTNRFTAMLAERTLSMNDRIQILSRQSIRDKLKALFSQYSGKYGPEFDLPFDRSDMAAYLGTDRSALSRELSRMKKEGLIDYNRNHFIIPQQDN